ILLTMFAIVGLTFALYATSEAEASRVYREAEVPTQPQTDPELLASYFLGQLIYDTDDFSGVFSALRGHGLARLIYGNYYARQANPIWSTATDPDIPNTVPFNGTGRLHTAHQATTANDPLAYMNPWNIDDYLLINYTYFPNALDQNPNASGLG